VYTLDAEKEPELAALFGVTGYPTVVFCPMEGSPQSISGYRPLEFWQEVIRYIFGIE
jgi:thioredoxin-related protein